MNKKTSLELELELAKINNQFLKEWKTISLKEASKLYSKVKEEIENTENGEVTEKIREKLANIFFNMTEITGEFATKWNENKIVPTDEELNLLVENIEDFLRNIDKVSEKFPAIISGDYCSGAKKGFEKIKEKIQEEKTHRQNNGGGGNNPPRPSNDSEINKQISSLQIQINALEQKQSQNPNSDTSQQDKQELIRLKSELASLKAKQNQQNDKNPKSNDFPWMAIGGGIVIAILLLIIAFLYKKSKK